MDQLLGTAREYLDLIHSLVVVLDCKGSVAYINPWTARLMDFEPTSIVGKNWFANFMPPENQAEAARNFQRILQRDGGLLRRESFVVSRDGTLHAVRWYHTLLKDAGGKILGTFSSGEDITDQKLFTQRLSQQRALLQRQLMQAIVESADRERQDLSAQLHDGVNQQLTVCQLLLEQEVYNGNASAQVEKTIRLIRSVIEEIRTLSHGLSGYDLKTVGLVKAVKQLAESLSSIGTLKVHLVVRGTRHLQQLSAPQCRAILCILQESTANTLKYAHATCIDILLIGSAAGADLEIRDNGKGFDKSKVKKGLGLSTIHSRASMLGGKAYLSSAEGEGTLWSVSLPLG